MNDDGGITASGYHWLGGETKRLSPKSFASNVLCQRHNSSLSALDAMALELFRALDGRWAERTDTTFMYQLSGGDIERWLLKVACGALESGNILAPDVDTSVTKTWLEILFGERDFEEGQGLYVAVPGDHVGPVHRGVSIGTVTSKSEKRLIGFRVAVCGLELLLSMVPMKDEHFRQFIVRHRPRELFITGKQYETIVELCWPVRKPGSSIIIRGGPE